MFYIDDLYIDNGSNCYTLYLNIKGGQQKIIGKCFVPNGLNMEANYVWSEKDLRDVGQMVMDGLKTSVRKATALQGYAQSAAGTLMQGIGQTETAQRLNQEAHKNIATGAVDVYKDYNKVPIYNHTDVKYRLPEVTFIFINKDDSDTMLKEVEKFLLMVAGLTEKGMRIKRDEETGDITWRATSYYNKGGRTWGEVMPNGQITYYNNGNGFILKQGAIEIKDLYLNNCTVTYSKDTDLKGRPHTVQIKLKFIQPVRYWAADLYHQAESIKIKATK